MVAVTPRDVLDFWFAPDMGFERWFKHDPDFDEAVRAKLGGLAGQAAAGDCDDWCETPDGVLALVLLLDQYPRNCLRGTADAFAQDARALEIARAALTRGQDLALERDGRIFLYLPFEHSEDLADQYLSEALFQTFEDEQITFYARRHREIIERFGRFPHRNAMLGRESTEAERRFLEEPHSSF